MRKLARASALATLCALVLNPQLADAQSAEGCSFGQPIVGAKRPNGDWGFGIPTRYETSHTGVDYVYQAGTPVVAVESGEIVYTGWWPPEGESAGYGFGPSVWIRHPCGSRKVMGFYAHLTDSTIAVVQGQSVAQGQVIGFIAPKGTGGPAVDIAHLHLGFREDGDPTLGYGWAGDWLDPDAFLAAEPIPEEEPPTPREETTVWGLKEWLVLLGAILLFLVWIGPLHAMGAGLLLRSGGWAVNKFLMALFFGFSRATKRQWRQGCLVGLTATACTWISIIGAAINKPLINWSVPSDGEIARFFHPNVLRWEADILRWANQYDLDPDLIATVMQIESCGDKDAVSPSGAQGLFQVMPYHFASGEVMTDPETNARRGLAYLQLAIAAYPGDIGHSLAAYNGGISGVSGPRDTWRQETQMYWYWGTGIFSDAEKGFPESPTLEEWLEADGASLCEVKSGH